MASATRSAPDAAAPPFFSSLRWRMTVWYGGVLALFVIAFAVAVYLFASRIVLSAAADRVDGVGQEIESFVRAEAHDPFGPVSAVTALADPTTLDSFVGPGLYVEVYNPSGFRIAKTANLHEADLPTSGYRSWPPPSRMTGSWGLADIATGPVLVRISPLRAVTAGKGAVVGTLYVAASLRGVYDEERGFAYFLMLSVALAIAAIAAASAWLARAAVGPINAIARAAREIGGDDLAKRVNWHGRRDELGALAATFDDMLARLEAAFARERRLIADASHELRTPLTVINANAQMLERWGDRDETVRREAVAAIETESANMARVLAAMLTLATTDDPHALAMERTELTPLVKDACAAMRPAAARKGLALEAEAGEPLFVTGEPGLLRQLVVNLVENAVKFTASGSVRVSLRRVSDRARLEVCDTGAGIAPAALPHVFERFYRADPARSRSVDGTGLGLAVVRNIVDVHGGSLGVTSEVGRGTTFWVEFALA